MEVEQQQQQQSTSTANTQPIAQQAQNAPNYTHTITSSSQCPVLEVSDKEDPIALEMKIKELDEYMDKVGVPLQKQPKEFRKAYNTYEDAYAELQAKINQSIQENVGLAGFTQSNADSLKKTLASKDISPEDKRGYYTFVAASWKKNELAQQQQNELRNAKKKLEDDLDSFKNASFGSKKVKIEEPTQKSSSSFTQKSSSLRVESEEMDEEPKFLNLLKMTGYEETKKKYIPLPQLTKHVTRMVGDHAQGSMIPIEQGDIFLNVMKGMMKAHNL